MLLPDSTAGGDDKGEGCGTTIQMLAAARPQVQGGPAHRARRSVGPPRSGLAVGETVILLHLPLPLVGVSIVMERWGAAE